MWCSVYVSCWCSGSGLTLGVCVIILLYIILYIIQYTYYIILYILYYTLLLFCSILLLLSSSVLSSVLPFYSSSSHPLIHSILSLLPSNTLLLFSLLFSPFLYSSFPSLLSSSLPHPFPYIFPHSHLIPIPSFKVYVSRVSYSYLYRFSF